MASKRYLFITLALLLSPVVDLVVSEGIACLKGQGHNSMNSSLLEILLVGGSLPAVTTAMASSPECVSSPNFWIYTSMNGGAFTDSGGSGWRQRCLGTAVRLGGASADILSMIGMRAVRQGNVSSVCEGVRLIQVLPGQLLTCTSQIRY